MDVKIYPNNFNAFITAEKVVDGNNQPLNDYVCNVTYTNLKDGQIAEIGQQFAKHLSDTDENGNSKAGLHRVALTGDYNDLINEPHNISYFTNDSGYLTSFTETDPIFNQSPAKNITQIQINKWDNYNYSNLPGAPILPIDDGEDNTGAYMTIENTRVIKPLQTIAFTGNYQHLFGVPEFANVAFSGDYNEIINTPKSFVNILNFSQYNNDNLNTIDNDNMKNLCLNTVAILDLNNFKKIKTNESEEDEYLITKLVNFCFDYLNNGKQLILQNQTASFLVTNIYVKQDNITEELDYIKLDYININFDNYETIRDTSNTITTNLANEQLSELQLTSSSMGNILIFDYFNDVIYCKQFLQT